MAKVTFTGDRFGHGPDVMRSFGCVLPKGEAVEVTDEKALAMFRTNRNFKVVEGAGKAPEPKAEPKPEPKAEEPQAEEPKAEPPAKPKRGRKKKAAE